MTVVLRDFTCPEVVGFLKHDFRENHFQMLNEYNIVLVIYVLVWGFPGFKVFYYMPRAVSGQDEPNLAL